ncbi:hypothetical protein [Paraprevotella clara]|uniref:hypothetical protein n=1 Tax=Paraprevotella clara TaxID=454154 RepID=UPI002670B2BC|nr:hypothetical protein [Paraprevotella clara]
MQINNTLFKRKILSFTLIQVALLSFLLILSVAVRLVLYPLSYLESLPLYFIVGFFFLWEMLQFFLVSREALEDSRNITVLSPWYPVACRHIVACRRVYQFFLVCATLVYGFAFFDVSGG